MDNSNPQLLPYYTHAGKIHADEVAAYSTLYIAGVCDRFHRLRDISTIPSDGIVGDIGREYKPELNRFDHHQGWIFRSNGIPYATFGLVWKKFGVFAVRKVLENLCIEEKAEMPEDSILIGIADRVDKRLVQGIDAHDASSEYELIATCGGVPVLANSLSDVVTHLNFNVTDGGHGMREDLRQDYSFQTIHGLMSAVIKSTIIGSYRVFVNRRRILDIMSYNNDIITLTEGIAWKEVVDLDFPSAKFIILPSNHPSNPYMLQAIPVKLGSREVKVTIERPEWFTEFIHQGKWIAGSDSIRSLTQLALYSIEQSEK